MDLQTFCETVKKKTLFVQEARGAKAEQMQIELSQFIGAQTQILLKQGYSINKIQNALRNALDFSSNSPTETNISNSEDSETYIEENISHTPHEISHFIPVKHELVQALETNKICEEMFLKHLYEHERTEVFLDALLYPIDEIIKMIVPNMKEQFTEGGEIVTTGDGEAVIPQKLLFTTQEEHQFLMCDPMIYKSKNEVQSINRILQTIEKEQFKKNMDISKLIEEDYFYQFDQNQILKEQESISNNYWNTFTKLRDLYNVATTNHEGIIIFIEYA